MILLIMGGSANLNVVEWMVLVLVQVVLCPHVGLGGLLCLNVLPLLLGHAAASEKFQDANAL